MPKTYDRMDRISDAIHRCIARVLREEFKDPRVGMVTVASVEVSRDMAHAKIYITVLEEQRVKEILQILNAASGFFRSQLASQLKLRVTPKPHFYFDDSVVKGNRISTLLSQDLGNDPQKFS